MFSTLAFIRMLSAANLVLIVILQSPDTLTLNEALARALEMRPEVVAAAGGIAQARGTSRVLRAIPNPSFQIQSEQATETRTITVAQPLSWIPRYGADRAAGRAVVELAMADSANRIAAVALGVRDAFYGALAAEERLRIAMEQAVLADSLVAIAEARLDVGDVSVLDRDQLAREAAVARLDAMRARGSALMARVDLARVTGLDVDAPPIPTGDLEVAHADLEGLQSRLEAGDGGALSSIPMLRAATADSAALAARLRSARWDLLPIPDLIAEREWGPDPFSSGQTRIGLSVPIPLWSQGREHLAEARGAAIEGAASAREVRLQVVAEIERARIQLRESAERSRFAREVLVPSAVQIRENTVRLYLVGETGVLPVLEALRAEREATALLVDEQLGVQRARAELLAILGAWE